MHVHKIESEKHKDFLLQNRIDPITGDLIVENDEVVFCASCKSVFLLDTWIYLDEKHCEQYETLEDFPSASVIHLKQAEETILFYQSLSNKASNNSNIPKKAKRKPWNHRQIKISKFQNFFHHPLLKIIKVGLWAVGLALFFTFKSPFILGAFLLSFVLEIIEALHNHYFGKKSKSVYNLFKSNTFYLTRKSIGFTEPYGINSYTLEIENIDKIFFDENRYLNSIYCIIYYKKDGKNKELDFSLPQEVFQNLTSLIDSLKLATGSTQLPIHIKSRSKNMSSHIKRLIIEGNTNFMLKDLS